MPQLWDPAILTFHSSALPGTPGVPVMLHAQITPGVPPNGSNYQTLPVATPQPQQLLHSNGVGRGPKGKRKREVGVREGPGKGKVTKA